MCFRRTHEKDDGTCYRNTQNHETLKATVEATNEELQKTNVNLSQLWVTAKEALEKSNVNEGNIKEIKNSNGKQREELKRQLKDDLKEEITELEERLTQSTNKILQELETLKGENEDLRKRSMRSILIFRSIPESEQNDAWEVVSKNLVNRLGQKLDLDHHDLDLQLSRAHRSPPNLILIKAEDQFMPSLLTGIMRTTYEEGL